MKGTKKRLQTTKRRKKPAKKGRHKTGIKRSDEKKLQKGQKSVTKRGYKKEDRKMRQQKATREKTIKKAPRKKG